MAFSGKLPVECVTLNMNIHRAYEEFQNGFMTTLRATMQDDDPCGDFRSILLFDDKKKQDLILQALEHSDGKQKNEFRMLHSHDRTSFEFDGRPETKNCLVAFKQFLLVKL